MSLFSILVDISANTANIESGIDRVVSKFDSLGDGIKRIGEVVTGGFFADLIKSTIDLGDQLETAAERAGVAGQAFSELVFGAKQSGVGIDQLSSAIGKMNQQLSLAGTGAKVPNEALAALGLTIKDLQGLSPDQEFEVLADRISKLQSPTDKARAAMDLFGKSAQELLPLLNQGAAGIEALRAKADSLGAAFSDETLKGLEDAHKSIETLTSAWDGMAATLVGKVAPALSTVLDRISGALSGDRVQQLKEEINFLQQVQGEGFLSTGTGTYSDIGTGYYSAAGGAALLRSLQGKLSLQSMILQPSQLQSPDMSALLNYGAPPGFQPNPLDQLQPITVSKQLPMFSSKYTLPGATAAPSLLSEFDKATIDSLTQAQQKFNDTQADLNVLLSSGVITQDQYNTRLNDASAAFTNLLDTKLPEFRVKMQKLPESFSAVDMAIDNFVDTTKSAFEQTLNESGNFGKNLVDNLLKAFANKELLNAIDNLGTAIEKALSVDVGSGSSFGNFIGWLFGASPINGSPNSYGNAIGQLPSNGLSDYGAFLQGYATGGSFTVGGGGGTDSQLIQFKATPGEKVSIRRPGQGGGDNYSIVVNATVGDVASRSDVVSGMNQAMMGAVAKIQDMKRRGALK